MQLEGGLGTHWRTVYCLIHGVGETHIDRKNNKKTESLVASCSALTGSRLGESLKEPQASQERISSSRNSSKRNSFRLWNSNCPPKTATNCACAKGGAWLLMSSLVTQKLDMRMRELKSMRTKIMA